MKNLFKQTKVIYDAHQKEYQVWYRNFFIWHFDSCYKHDTSHPYTPHYAQKKEEAEKRAVDRAKAMLNTVEVWRGSNFAHYP
jgi:hypothetical protein